VRDVHRIPLLKDLPAPAVIRVAVSMLADEEPLGEVWSPVVLKLNAEPLSLEDVAHPLTYTLDGKIRLVGYNVSPGSDETEIRESAPVGALTVTLYWVPLTKMDEDFSVFVHVRHDGGLYGQGDGPPFGNDYPTSHWSPDELLADTHVITLEGVLPADAYLLVGLYRLSDGTRLPVYSAAGERVPDDAIVLDVLR
jgi:hypothetical protein